MVWNTNDYDNDDDDDGDDACMHVDRNWALCDHTSILTHAHIVNRIMWYSLVVERLGKFSPKNYGE